ncbi:MAG: hypothetical protein AB4040_00260 [Synechococcus sp.]
MVFFACSSSTAASPSTYIAYFHATKSRSRIPSFGETDPDCNKVKTEAYASR